MDEKQTTTEYAVEAVDSVYQTGSTKPPKSHTGIILVLLGIVIFLGGIVTALGVTNIRLFQALSDQTAAIPDAVHFSNMGPQLTADDGQPTGLGFCGETVSDFWHTYHQLPHGIFIQTVDKDSDAARKGVLPGDILTHINGQPVTAFEDIQQLMENTDGPVEVVLRRDEEKITLQLDRPE